MRVWALIERVRQEGLAVELDWDDEPTPARDWPASVRPRHALRSDATGPASVGLSHRAVPQGSVELYREPVRPRPYLPPGSGVHTNYY
ncbi:MAG TPA: hypothetical protein VHW44_20870 [Pseudonocardiaceae bacterium]|nr:hypothetical protein [Pseudonocardiaceae bacterium]